MGKKILIILMFVPVLLKGQEERKYIREGYKAYMDGNFTEAEVDFRKAEDVSDNSFNARYNTSTALYQQDKLEESGERFAELSKESTDPADQAKLLHNIGNVMLKGQQYQQAVDAYKQSLKINPDDEDTRYNLAYALEKLRQQQQDQQQQQNENDQQQDQQKNDDEQQQDQQKNSDDQQQDQQQDQQKEQPQNKEQQEQQEQDQQQQQSAKQELSKEEAERLLDAILQKEKNVKEKVDKQNAKAAKIKTDKDW